MQQNRRSFLKAGGVLAAMGLAGCTGGLLDGGDGGDSGQRDWKYDPGTLAEVENTFFADMAYGQIYDNREYLPTSTEESFEMGEDVPLEASDIDMVSGVGGARLSIQGGTGSGFGSAAILGSWDKSTMVDLIESEGEATEAGEYEGFTLYEDPESTAGATTAGLDSQGSVMAGVGDGAILIGAAMSEGTDIGVTGEDTVTTMIDTSNGDTPLLSENSEHVGQLESAISANSMIVGGEVNPALVELALQQAGSAEQRYVEGLRAGGFGASIEGETTTFTIAILYETASVAENTGLAELANGLAPQLEDETPALDSLEAEYDENAIVVDMSGKTQRIFEEGMNTTTGNQFGLVGPDAFGTPGPF